MKKKEYIEQIASLLAQRDWDSAVRLAGAALSEFKDEGKFYALRGYAYLRTFRNQESKEDFAEALDKGVADFENYCNYGVVLNRLKMYEQAIDAFSKALAKRKGDMGARLGLVTALRGADSNIEAWDELNRLVGDFPDRDEVYNARGYFYEQDGDLQKALGDYDKAVSLRSDVAVYYLNRGNVRLRLFDAKSAEEDYKKAAELEAGNPVAQFSLGYCLLMRQLHQEALSYFDRALEITPSYYRALVFRGLAKAILKFFQSALEDFEEAINLDPLGWYGCLAKAMALAELGKDEAARRAIENSKARDEPHCQSFLKTIGEGAVSWDLRIFESLMQR